MYTLMGVTAIVPMAVRSASVMTSEKPALQMPAPSWDWRRAEGPAMLTLTLRPRHSTGEFLNNVGDGTFELGDMVLLDHATPAPRLHARGHHVDEHCEVVGSLPGGGGRSWRSTPPKRRLWPKRLDAAHHSLRDPSRRSIRACVPSSLSIRSLKRITKRSSSRAIHPTVSTMAGVSFRSVFRSYSFLGSPSE